MVSGPVEVLGEVVLSSGTLVVIDFGLLGMWSHSESPQLEDGDPELAERANSAVDLQIVGPDATALARHLDLAVAKETFVFDMPPDGIDMVRSKVALICDSLGLEAQVVEIDRMPHGERVARLVALQPLGVEVPFHGPWAVSAGGLPTGAALPVYGVRMPTDAPDAGRWKSVWLDVADGTAADSIEMGHVLVDEARLMLFDVDLLGAWVHNDSLDGLYDVAFWGRDAVEVASITGATQDPLLGNDVFGWVDLGLERAREVVPEIGRMKEAGELKFAADVRPHSHHHQILRQTVNSPTESGSIGLAGGRGVGFFTTWGDGAFPVYRDVAEDGTLLRVRIELGSDEIVARSRRLEELWFGSLSQLAFVSAAVANDGAPVGFMYREPTDRENDSGWCVLAGNESDEHLDDPANVVLLPLRDVIAFDEQLEELLSRPAPVAFERAPTGELRECEPPAVRD